MDDDVGVGGRLGHGECDGSTQNRSSLNNAASGMEKWQVMVVLTIGVIAAGLYLSSL